MSPMSVIVLFFVTNGLLVTHVFSDRVDTEYQNILQKKYTFLYFTSLVDTSHFYTMTRSAHVLGQQGHKVVFLRSSSGKPVQSLPEGPFSFVVFNSSYTKQDRTRIFEDLSKVATKKTMTNLFTRHLWWWEFAGSGRYNLGALFVIECDNLLGDSVTISKLQEEKFDMMVGDLTSRCVPLIAQLLDIPFVLIGNQFAFPIDHGLWSGLPMEPSFIPARLLGLTDRMTPFQRVLNLIGHVHTSRSPFVITGIDQLKIKHNIKPEISAYRALQQARMYFYLGSFGLEYPRPMQPNTVYVLHSVGLNFNQTIEHDVAEFLDSATTGVALCSLGSFFAVQDQQQAQLFADGFAMLPHRVLWQAKDDMPLGVKLGNNTKFVKWLPLPKIMEHKNVKAYISQVGAPAMNEALWAGIPIVGIPLYEDQPDNALRLVTRGVGVSLDITTLTPEALSGAIHDVITKPKYGKNAERISRILRDLETASPPVETVVHWILHVTRFGGDHLRPAVQDLSFPQSLLLDVYLFLFVVLAYISGLALFSCCCCFKCVRRMCKGGGHLKRD